MSRHWPYPAKRFDLSDGSCEYYTVDADGSARALSTAHRGLGRYESPAKLKAAIEALIRPDSVYVGAPYSLSYNARERARAKVVARQVEESVVAALYAHPDFVNFASEVAKEREGESENWQAALGENILKRVAAALGRMSHE